MIGPGAGQAVQTVPESGRPGAPTRFRRVETRTMSIRLILADDHKVVRDGLCALLEREADLTVVAEASDGREAVRLAAEHEPMVVVMDVGMPALNGIEATAQIRANTPATRVLALSIHADKRFVERMLKAGASGYLLKNCAARELVRAIREVAAGKGYLSPEIAGLVVADLVQPQAPDQRPGAYHLTPREREVLQLIAEGLTSKQIAGDLGLSEKTVQGHRQQIMDKLDLRSVAELTKFAVREGITSL